MPRKICAALVAASVAIAGCAGTKTVRYQVQSEPSGATVEVNGTYMGKTPTGFTWDVPRRWVGLFNAPGGWAYHQGVARVRIIPPSGGHEGERLTSQTKAIRPAQHVDQGETTIRANLFLEPTRPVQPIEVR